MSTGLLIIICDYLIQGKSIKSFFCFLGCLFITCVHLYRKRNAQFNAQFNKYFGFILRQHEITDLPAAAYFLYGALFVSLFVPEEITTLSLVVLTFGDPLASIIGIYFGANKYNVHICKGKSLFGSLASGLASMLVSICIYHCFNQFNAFDNILGRTEFLILTFAVGFLAEISPSSRKYCLDDNFTIPVYASIYYVLYFCVFK